MQFGVFRLPFLSREDSAVALKEVKVFVRDLSRWSQLVMMVPLIGFYLLNMAMLPFRDQFFGVYYLLNLFMIAFIAAAVGARYLFPAISWEGPPLWLVRASPYPLWRMVAIKFCFLSAPLAVLTVALTVFSFRLLEFPLDLLPSALTMQLAMTLLLCAMAVGFGAAMPRFRFEHHLEISLGPGGVIYMLTAVAAALSYICLIAGPGFGRMGRSLSEWWNWSFSSVARPTTAFATAWTTVCVLASTAFLLWGSVCLEKREDFDR